MFDISQVKQNVGKWTKQGDESDTGTSSTSSSETARPRASRSSHAAQEPATIGPSIRINGDLTREEDLIIEGQVEGTIHLEKNDLTIGSHGRIKANIHAKGVIVEGELRGDIIGKEKVVIRRTGNMRGNIIAPRVTLEDGAMFKGSIEMEPDTARNRDRETTTGGSTPVASLSKETSGSTAVQSDTGVSKTATKTS